MTVLAQPGERLDTGPLTDLPSGLRSFEAWPVPQLGVRALRLQAALREDNRLNRFGTESEARRLARIWNLTETELMVISFHLLADEWRAVEARQERERLERMFGAPATYRGPARRPKLRIVPTHAARIHDAMEAAE